MHTRTRAIMVAAALLYLGPLLAGLGGYGWPVVPVFAAIFLLWLVVMRPQHWPRALGGWAVRAPWVRLAGQGLVQLLLVGVLFGLGRGLGGVFGTVPPVPVMLPVGLSLLAVPVARLVWDPWQADAMDRFVDSALAQVAGHPDPALAAFEAASQAIRPVLALPPGTPEAALLAALARHAQGAPADVVLAVLMDGAQAETGTGDVARRLLVLFATDPAQAAPLRGFQAPLRAAGALADDADLLGLFARRALVALRADPRGQGDFPRPAWLADRAAEYPMAAPDLAALAAALGAGDGADA